MTPRSLILAGLVLATSTAFAEGPRYKRTQHLVVEVNLSDRVKPIQPVAPPTKPATGDDILRIEEHNAPLRLEQEKILAQLVKDTPDSDPDKPDLLFRLAEHYAKAAAVLAAEVPRSRRARAAPGRQGAAPVAIELLGWRTEGRTG